jgi:hypothetical protein
MARSVSAKGVVSDSLECDLMGIFDSGRLTLMLDVVDCGRERRCRTGGNSSDACKSAVYG